MNAETVVGVRLVCRIRNFFEAFESRPQLLAHVQTRRSEFERSKRDERIDPPLHHLSSAGRLHSTASIPKSFTFLFSVLRLIPRKSAALVFTPPHLARAFSIRACSSCSMTSW